LKVNDENRRIRIHTKNTGYKLGFLLESSYQDIDLNHHRKKWAQNAINPQSFSSRFLSSHLNPVRCVVKPEEELLRLDGIAEPELPERGKVPELRVSLLQVAHRVLNVLAREMVGSDHRFRLSHQLIHHLLVALRGEGEGFNQTKSVIELIQ
jgi:hypothetical protein